MILAPQYKSEISSEGIIIQPFVIQVPIRLSWMRQNNRGILEARSFPVSLRNAQINHWNWIEVLRRHLVAFDKEKGGRKAYRRNELRKRARQLLRLEGPPLQSLPQDIISGLSRPEISENLWDGRGSKTQRRQKIEMYQDMADLIYGEGMTLRDAAQIALEKHVKNLPQNSEHRESNIKTAVDAFRKEESKFGGFSYPSGPAIKLIENSVELASPEEISRFGK